MTTASTRNRPALRPPRHNDPPLVGGGFNAVLIGGISIGVVSVVLGLTHAHCAARVRLSSFARDIAQVSAAADSEMKPMNSQGPSVNADDNADREIMVRTVQARIRCDKRLRLWCRK